MGVFEYRFFDDRMTEAEKIRDIVMRGNLNELSNEQVEDLKEIVQGYLNASWRLNGAGLIDAKHVRDLLIMQPPLGTKVKRQTRGGEDYHI